MGITLCIQTHRFGRLSLQEHDTLIIGNDTHRVILIDTSTNLIYLLKNHGVDIKMSWDDLGHYIDQSNLLEINGRMIMPQSSPGSLGGIAPLQGQGNPNISTPGYEIHHGTDINTFKFKPGDKIKWKAKKSTVFDEKKVYTVHSCTDFYLKSLGNLSINLNEKTSTYDENMFILATEAPDYISAVVPKPEYYASHREILGVALGLRTKVEPEAAPKADSIWPCPYEEYDTKYGDWGA